MGYYTYYTIQIFDESGKDITDIIKGESDLDDIMVSLNEYPEYMALLVREFRHDRFYGLLMDEGCKWYDHEEELNKLSTKYPQIIFKLCGEGETQGDMWIKYFHNGKMKVLYPELVWPHFDIKEFTRGE
jgi:hypothetical protein